MRKLCLISFLCCTVLMSAQTKQNYYISSTLGKDGNPGTEEAPLLSISSLTKEQKTDATIYLRCGDIFFESLVNCTDCHITSYGEGKKPLLCGFRVMRDAEGWQKDIPGVWRLDMSDAKQFYGYRAGYGKQFYGNIGCLYIPEENRILGQAVASKEKLKNEYDFFVTSKVKKSELTQDDFKYLYVKSDERPGAYCLTSGTNGISNMNNCIIENIAVVGFGGHGIQMLHDCIVRNCDVDIMGGSILLGTRTHWARYGNGIELWIGKNPCNGNTIENCQFSRCYDVGATIQGPSSQEVHSANNHFRNNRMAYCRQGFEHWAETTDGPAIFENCDFVNNILFCCGDNKFEGTPVHDNDVALLAYKAPAKEFIISDNLIYGKAYRFNQGCTPGVGGNEVYIHQGGGLLHVTGKTFKTVIPATDSVHLNFYRAYCGDDSKITFLIPDSTEDMAVRTRIMRALKFKYPSPNRNEIEVYK